MSSKSKALKLVVATSIILVLVVTGVFAYKFNQKAWVERYNRSQWDKYVASFNVTKEVAKPYIQCFEILTSKMSDLQPAYEERVTSEGLGLTTKEVFDANLFSFLRGLTESLESEVGYYAQETPQLQSGIFILDSFDNKKLSISRKTINERLPETEESLNWYKNRFEKDQVEKISRLYCPTKVVSEPAFFSYPLSMGSCLELMKIKNSFEDALEKDEGELDVEYTARLNRFNKQLEDNLARCNDASYLLKFGY